MKKTTIPTKLLNAETIRVISASWVDDGKEMCADTSYTVSSRYAGQTLAAPIYPFYGEHFYATVAERNAAVIKDLENGGHIQF